MNGDPEEVGTTATAKSGIKKFIMDRLSKIEKKLKHEQQFRKELELRSDQPKTVQENILPDCLTVDRSREGLSAVDTVGHPEGKKDTQSDQSQSDPTQDYVLLTQFVQDFPC